MNVQNQNCSRRFCNLKVVAPREGKSVNVGSERACVLMVA